MLTDNMILFFAGYALPLRSPYGRESHKFAFAKAYKTSIELKLDTKKAFIRIKAFCYIVGLFNLCKKRF
ncbi:hypothetical protein GCM10011344_22650 [Dokdonia pacifica]|nr:hypothetical protein GCM10011344_22650 [Dokdonia pacifica]